MGDPRRAVQLIEQMEEEIAYFESMVHENELFEPELRLSRQIVEGIRSGSFSPREVIDEVNFLDDHYNGIGWSGFVHHVADYLKLCGEDWEVVMWPLWDLEEEYAYVILPKVAPFTVEGRAPASLLDHLNQVILPHYRRLSEGHRRFEQAYLVAKNFIDQLVRGIDPFTLEGSLNPRPRGSQLQDDTTCFRLGGPHSWSTEFLNCAKAYAAQLGSHRD